ncbi:MAG: hypothetical protein OEW11_10135 [Nitrospirota bacterium]|nr:hypothetical protein [Nitrospirota bacterium]
MPSPPSTPAAKPPPPHPPRTFDRPLRLACAALLIVAHVGLARGFTPITTWFYPLVWWPYVLLVDRLAWRRGAPSLLEPPSRLWRMALLSLPFWLLFEALNLRLENWHYVGLPENWLVRTSGTLLSFATVLPLMWVTAELLGTFPAGRMFRLRLRPLPVTPRLCTAMRVSGTLCLLLPLLWPGYFFALVWASLTLLLEPFNHRAGRPSLLADLERGEPRRLILLLVAGLICGGLWEAWNYRATAKWIYSVPFLTGTHWFEMPPLGFLGFPALALEGFAFYHFACGWRGSRRARWLRVVGITLLCAAALWGMDRYTVRPWATAGADRPPAGFAQGS